MLMSNANASIWLKCSQKDGTITLQMTGKAVANRDTTAWDLSTLVFQPVETKQDRAALTSAWQAEKGINHRLREDLKAIETQFHRLQAEKLALERENRKLKAQSELLKNPPGGRDLEELQTDFDGCLTRIRSLTSEVSKAKLRLRLVPEPEPSERRNKRVRTTK